MTIATKDQIEKQIARGLDLGCSVCHFKMETDLDKPLTVGDVNLTCVVCEKPYCRKHQSSIDIHFCELCLPGSQK